MAEKDVRNIWSLTDPTPLLEPTLIQVFPQGWRSADAPCQIVVGNWLDGTTMKFMDEFNVQVIVKVSDSVTASLKPLIMPPVCIVAARQISSIFIWIR